MTEWVYRVNTTQLKLAEERVKKLQGSVNKVIKDSIALQDKQKTSLNMLKQSYDKLAAATNKVARAEKKKNVVEKIGLKQRMRNLWAMRASAAGGGGRRGGGKGGFSTRFGNSGMSTIGVGAGAAALAGGGFAVKSIIGLAAEFERNQKTFAAMLKSDEKANQLLADLKDFAKQTPFELTKIRGTATRILGAGYQQNEIIPLMRRLGDLSMGDQDKFNRLLINVAEIKNNDRATIRDIRQFSGVGVDIKSAIQKVTGWDKKDIGGMITAGKVNNKVITDAITYLTTKGVFAGGMEAYQSTLVGKWSNLIDTMQGIGEDAGKGSLSSVLKEMVDGTRGFLDENGYGISRYIGGVLTAFGTFFTSTGKTLKDVKGLIGGSFGMDLERVTALMKAFGLGLVFLVSPLTALFLIVDTLVKTLQGAEGTWLHDLLGVRTKRQINNDQASDLIQMIPLEGIRGRYNRMKEAEANPTAANWLQRNTGYSSAVLGLALKRGEIERDSMEAFNKVRGQFDSTSWMPSMAPTFEFNESRTEKGINVIINVEGDINGDGEEIAAQVGAALPPASFN